MSDSYQELVELISYYKTDRAIMINRIDYLIAELGKADEEIKKLDLIICTVKDYWDYETPENNYGLRLVHEYINGEKK